ncbi:MAG: hypothetical protein AAGL96_02045 [Pseudomonadota bacterium]
MKTTLTIAALVVALGVSAGTSVTAGALNTFPDNIQFPTDFDGFVSADSKQKVKVTE